MYLPPEKLCACFKTKEEAIDYGREVSRNQGTEFIIHNKDGKIAQKDIHGTDPKNIPG